MMNKRNILSIGFVIMLILNAVLLFLMIRGPKMPPRQSELSNKIDLKEKISRDLELTTDQTKAFHELADKHRKAIKVNAEKQKKVIQSYFNYLSVEEQDQTRLSELLEDIKDLESKKITLTYQHFEELKALCNEDQKARFGLIIQDIIQVLVGKERNNRPPPRGF